MKNKDYKAPVMEVVKLDFADIVTTSGDGLPKRSSLLPLRLFNDYESAGISFDNEDPYVSP